jgi:hypothetical protein
MSNTADTAASDNKPQREELGALWKREGRNQTYLTGYMVGPNGVKKNIVVFSSNKKKDNQPDFRIYESVPMENRVDSLSSKKNESPKPLKPKANVQEVAEDADDGNLL